MPPERHIDMLTTPALGRPALRAGFTLVELLVASTLGLMAMAAVASLFATFGRTVSQSQTVIDSNARLRNAAWRLRQDLQGMTAPVKSWVRPEANAGYFEIAEGPGTTTNALPGDCDDWLALTTVSLGNSFTGRLQGADGFESPVAEVAWFCAPSGQSFDGQSLFNLYRRQLLVSATPGAGSFTNGVAAAIDRALSDISCRDVASSGQIANSLADLTKPANRFWTVGAATRTLQGDRLGEDVILFNVLAFDVRWYTAAGGTRVDQSFSTNYTESGPPTNTPVPPGIEVRIRCVDPTSRQVRQLTVVHAFDTQ